MKTTLHTLVVLALLLSSQAPLFSQNSQKHISKIGPKENATTHNHDTPHRNCHAMDVLDRQIEEDPQREIRMQEMERFTENYVQEYLADPSRNTDCRTIPVVVTVVYANNQENISLAQIESQLAVLNEDFGGTNSDFNPPAEFAGVAAGNTNIQFVLDDVRRYSNSRSSWGTNDLVKSSYPPVSPSTTLNMWVCNIGGGILGYAQFPGGSASTDGVVMSPQYFGSSDYGSGFYLSAPFDKGRTTTHEVGHYLNLRHIWGDGNCSADDFVNDTPIAGGANYNCPSYPTNSCSSAGNDMFMNYMDYVNDDCMYMFSTGQSARMWACLNSSRSSLGSDCGSTGGGTGGGGSTGGGSCFGENITFTLTTDNYGSETSWTLEDASGNVVESGDNYGNNQTVTLNWTLATGNYTFTINDQYSDGICCSYGNGSYSINEGSTNIASGGSFAASETQTFCVEAATGGGTGGGGSTPTDCPTIDLDAATIDSYGGSRQDYGTSSVSNGVLVLNGNAWKSIDYNYTVTPNTVIELEFGSLQEGEIQGIGFDNNNSISKDYTFRLYGTQDNWGISDYDNYATSAGSWKAYTIPVGQFYTGSFNRLIFACDDDANANASAYFRNIKIYEAGSCGATAKSSIQEVNHVITGIEGEDEVTAEEVRLYPNPATSAINIDIAGINTTEAQIMDATGRTLWSGTLDAGVNTVNINNLPAGMYNFMLIQTNGKVINKTFIKRK